MANLSQSLASAAPLPPIAGTDGGRAPPAMFGSAGVAKQTSGAFAGLGGDQALLSLLSYLAKSDLLKNSDAEPRKPEPKPEPQTQSA